jgi:phosphate starvation-inducible protein PhoH
LANDVIELVKSLGGRAILHERNRLGKSNILNGIEIICRKVSYEFTISMPENMNPFYISRKANLHKKRNITQSSIKSIEYSGEKEVQCILVDNPEHLYVTDDFIVTHNTEEEKLAPWFQSIMDSLEVLFTMKGAPDWKRELEVYKKKGRIEMEAITYIRGRSLPNCIIMLDEAQNLSSKDIKTLLTRAGVDSKVIILGDISQIMIN